MSGNSMLEYELNDPNLAEAPLGVDSIHLYQHRGDG